MKRFPSIVRLPKQKRFQYPARYYDENRERFEELHRRAEAHQNTEQEDTETRFRGAFKATTPQSHDSLWLITLVLLLCFSFILWWETGWIALAIPSVAFVGRYLYKNHNR